MPALLLIACGGDDESVAKPDVDPDPEITTPEGCPAGEAQQSDESCLQAGIQPDGCPAGQAFVDDACIDAGIPPENCGPGFAPAAGACEPILPETVCPSGAMAVPGDEACREVMPCPSTPWGDIPDEGQTVFVDDDYVAGDSDGTQAKPFPTIAEALAVVSDGGIVAVEAGSYAEAVWLDGKAVVLQGICPAQVEILAADGDDAAIRIDDDASGSEVRGIAVTGAAVGVRVVGATNVVLDRLWVHDLADYGLSIGDEASVEATGLLVEGASGRGVYVEGAELTASGLAVRDTIDLGVGGRGLNIRDNPQTEVGGSLIISGSLVERSVESAAIVHASTMTMDTTVLRNTVPLPNDRFGRGLTVQLERATAARGAATITRSYIGGHSEGGLLVTGSDLVLEDTVIADIEVAQDTGIQGNGLVVQHDPDTLERSSAEVRRVVIERASEIGFFLAGSEATVDSTVIRDIRPIPSGGFGRGASIQADGNLNVPSELLMRFSRIERTSEVGMMVQGSMATLEAVLIQDIFHDESTGLFGRGVTIQEDPDSGARSDVEVRYAVVERAREDAFFAQGSDLLVESTRVSEMLPDERFDSVGFAVAGQVGVATMQRANVRAHHSLFEGCFAGAAMSVGADMELVGVHIRDTRAQPNDGAFGDGVSALSDGGQVASLTVQDCLIEKSARAAIATFGANAAVGGTTIDCNVIDLNGEPWGNLDFDLVDLENNECGCQDEASECRLLSSDLTPPEPLEAMM